MIIKAAEERSVVDIDIEHILGAGGAINIYSQVTNYFSIDFKPKTKSFSFVAGGYIGLIPVNEKIAIDIRPKFKISNLTRLVSIAEDNFKTLDFFNRSYQDIEGQDPTVFKFLLQCLVRELKVLEVEGLLKEYLPRRFNGTRIAGRIDYPRTVRKFWSKGAFHKASSSYFEMTINNPYNQLIKFTIDYSLRYFNRMGIDDLSLKRQLIHALSLFESVSLIEDSRRLNQDVSDLIAAEKVTMLRHYYLNVCKLCRIITTQKGLSFNTYDKGTDLSSFILDMESIFERYLLNVLRNNKPLLDQSVSILDGNAEGKKKFFNQPSKATGDAKPDFILNVGGETKVIADAKYKIKVKDIDRYQVISHALSYGAKYAVLVSPVIDHSSTAKLSKIGTIGPTDAITLYEYKFDLNAIDLESEENSFAIALAKLAT